MEIIYNIKDRKPFVNAMEEITGTKAVYKRTPTYAYEVDCFTITREGNLEFSDLEDTEKIAKVLEKLKTRGFDAENSDIYLKNEDPISETKEEIAEEQAPLEEPSSIKETPVKPLEDMGLTVTMPKAYFTEESIKNLRTLITAKQNLIKKAFGIEELPIEETDETIRFPWFAIKPADSVSVTAYTKFIYALCELAGSQKRITAKEREVENEKYAFRCLLLRLGFIGDEYKTDRKILLKNLSGSAAFKDKKDKRKKDEVAYMTEITKTN